MFQASLPLALAPSRGSTSWERHCQDALVLVRNYFPENEVGSEVCGLQSQARESEGLAFMAFTLIPGALSCAGGTFPEHICATSLGTMIVFKHQLVCSKCAAVEGFPRVISLKMAACLCVCTDHLGPSCPTPSLTGLTAPHSTIQFLRKTGFGSAGTCRLHPKRPTRV